MLVHEYGLRVISPDPPGHGEIGALPADSHRPSALAEVAADLLTELGVDRAVFVGFSWGARVGCSFAARFPERTVGLALIDGGYVEPGDVGADLTVDLTTCVAEAREEIEEDSFVSWEAYFAFERESLKRWTPAGKGRDRVTMRELDGRVVPILEPEALGAIKHGGRREPVTETYAPIAAAGVPVLLVTAPEPDVPEVAEMAVERFRNGASGRPGSSRSRTGSTTSSPTLQRRLPSSWARSPLRTPDRCVPLRARLQRAPTSCRV